MRVQSFASTTSGSLGDQAPDELSHGLVLAFGVPHAELGRRIAFTDELLVGRASPNFGEGYRTLSRRHAEITSDSGRLVVRDLGSRFGTAVNGQPVTEAHLFDGDVVTFGRVGAVVASAPARFVPGGGPSIGQASWKMQELRDDLSAALRTEWPIAIVGQPGVGKQTLASELVAAIAPGEAALLVVDATLEAPSDEVLRAQSTVVFAHMEQASTTAHEACLRLLRRGGGPRVIVLTEAMCRLTSELRGYFEATSFHIPSLSERREDILPTVRAHLHQLAGREIELSPELALGLLRRTFATNLRGLGALTERLYRRREDAVRASGLLAADLPVTNGIEAEGEPASAQLLTATAATLRIAEDGTWFRKGDQLVELGHRKPLARALACLAGRLHAGPPSVVSQVDLITAGWPGESIRPAAAANRLHVAISTLRALGLEEALVRRGVGYSLVGDVRVG